jgi:hypothetical protein
MRSTLVPNINHLILALTGALVVPALWSVWLSSRIRRTRESLDPGLAQLATSAQMLLESGAATPNSALAQAAASHSGIAPDVVREALRLREVRRISFHESFDEVATRYGIESLHRMADTFRMSQMGGTSMARPLHDFASALRQDWQLRYSYDPGLLHADVSRRGPLHRRPAGAQDVEQRALVMHWSRTRRAGQAMVEFAMTLPLVVLLIVGTANLAAFIHHGMMLQYAVWDGAHQASLLGHTPEDGVRRVLEDWREFEAGGGRLQVSAYRTGRLVVIVAKAPNPLPAPLNRGPLQAQTAHELDVFESGSRP